MSEMTSDEVLEVIEQLNEDLCIDWFGVLYP